MEWDIVHTVLTVFAILSASLISLMLSVLGRNKEVRERIVSEILFPLRSEVEGNVDGIRRVTWRRNSEGLNQIVFLDDWENVKRNPLWLVPYFRGLRDRVENVYVNLSDYETQWRKAWDRSQEIVVGQFWRLTVNEEALPNGDVEMVRAEIRNGLHGLWRDGFIMFTRENWGAVRNQYHSDVTDFVQSFYEKFAEMCRGPISADDYLIRVGKAVEGDAVITRFEELRNNILTEGAKLGKDLRKRQDRLIVRLYGRVLRE